MVSYSVIIPLGSPPDCQHKRIHFIPFTAVATELVNVCWPCSCNVCVLFVSSSMQMSLAWSHFHHICLTWPVLKHCFFFVPPVVTISCMQHVATSLTSPSHQLPTVLTIYGANAYAHHQPPPPPPPLLKRD